MDFKNIMKQARLEMNYTQAEYSNALGLSFSTVNRWEKGKSKPNRKTAIAIIALAKQRNVSTTTLKLLSDTLFQESTLGEENPNHEEENNSIIKQIIDEAAVAVSICDSHSYELHYVNKAAEKLIGIPLYLSKGKKCYEYFMHRSTPCPNCKRNKHSFKKYFSMNYTSPFTQKEYLIKSKLINWKGNESHIEYIVEQSLPFQPIVHTTGKKENLSISILKEILISLFREENLDKALSYLSNDIHCYGASPSIVLENKHSVRDFIEDKISQLKDYTLILLDGKEISSFYDQNWSTVYFIIQKADISIQYQLTGLVRSVSKKQKVTILQISLVSPTQSKGDIFEAFAVQSMMKNMALSNQQFENLLQHTKCGICISRIHEDNSLEIQYFSDGFCELFEGKREELEQLYFYDYLFGIDEQDKERYISFCQTQLQNLDEGEITYRILTLKKNRKWITMKISTIVNEVNDKICYTTYFDVTQQMTTQNQLRQNEYQLKESKAMIEAACDFSSIWIWTYDLDSNIAHIYKKAKEDFNLGDVLEDFPTSWLNMNYLLDEFKELYAQKCMELKKGKDHVEFDCKLWIKGEIHWVRCHFNRFEERRNTVICSCHPIDIEVSLRAQNEMEKKKQVSSDPHLLSYMISNLSRNKLLDYKEIQSLHEDLNLQISYEENILLALSSVAYPEEKEKFLETHNLQKLLALYESGETRTSISFHRLRKDGKIMMEKDLLCLLRNPENGDIYLYETCYDIHYTATIQEVLTAAVNYAYERFGSINLDTQQITLLYNSRERIKMAPSIVDFKQASYNYANQNILEKEREQFLEKIKIEVIHQHLQDHNEYKFTHRTLEDGRIHVKLNRFILYDTVHHLVLMTRNDITEKGSE